MSSAKWWEVYLCLNVFRVMHIQSHHNRVIFSKVPTMYSLALALPHDDVIKWKHFPRYWPFVRGIQQSSVNSPNKGQ